MMRCFRECRTIPFSVIQSAADFFLLPYAMIFGVVYDCSFKLIEEQGNYKSMLDYKFLKDENQKTFEEIKREIVGFIEGRG